MLSPFFAKGYESPSRLRGPGVGPKKVDTADNHAGFSLMTLSLYAGGIPAKRRTFIVLCTHYSMVNRL